ncbi:serum response factor-like [Pholidichthys leucotaenia]
MLAGSEPSMGSRTGPDGPAETEVIYSGSEQDSESGEEDDQRGLKRERSDEEPNSSSSSSGLSGARPGKKTRGRVKIKMEFIDNKLRRYTTFSKRKTGIMKKAYELSTLTGTQVLLLVASETGHVYTFATRKLQPMITSETGKALIQTCLNSPDSPPRSDPSSDQRMSATGFEETDLTYQVSEGDGGSEGAKDLIKPTFSVPTPTTPSSTSQAQTSISSSNGAVLKTSAGVILPGGFSLVSGPGVSQQLQSVQLQSNAQPVSTSQSSSDGPTASSSSSAGLPVSIVSSSSGHMMYPGSHTFMYATSTPSLNDSGLAVLNAFNATGHSQSHDPAAVSQVILTSLPAAQIPVSAVQLHPMVIGQQGGNNLTELQVISLDVHQSKDD